MVLPYYSLEGENMLEKLKKLETLVGLNLQDWTEETLLAIIQDEKIIKELTPELAIYMIELHESGQIKNEVIIDVLKPVKYAHYLREVQAQVDEYLEKASNRELTKDEFEALINSMIQNGGPLQKAGGYLTLLMVLDTDIRERKEDISNVLSDIIDIVNSLNVDTAFEVDSKLVDLVNMITEAFFQKYQEDVLTRKDDFESILRTLDEKIEEIQSYLAEMGYTEDELEEEQEHIHDENCGHAH